MSEKKLPFVFIVLNLIILNGVVLAVLNLRYPLVGHDYTYAIPSFLDTAIHYRLNGLSIQWFTPTFGGGLPVFSNPNNMQFSIPAFLSVFLPPWIAVMVSVTILVSAGFLACYYLFQRTLQLHWTAAILGAFFFSANGFVVTRAATGQLGYLFFALLPLLLILLLDESLPVKISVPLLGLFLAMLIYSAGYFVILIFGLSILMLLPMFFLYKPDLFHWKRILGIIGVGGVIGVIISASKLVATFAFMRYFPRLIADNYPTSFFVGLQGIVLQLLGTLNLVPLSILGGMEPAAYPNFTRAATGANYGMWELDISMTPVVFIIVLVCMRKFIHNPRKYLSLVTNNKEKIALLLFVLFTYVAIEFVLAKGFIYPTLRHLPILSSLRANVRFTGAFILPLAFFASAVYNHWSRIWDKKKLLRTYLLVNLLAVMPLGSYFLFKEDMFWAFYDIAGPQKIYEEMQAGNSFEITGIGNPAGKNTGALLYRTSNLNVYEPVFGFQLENFHPQIKSGSVWEISDGYYNMTDPTGYMYPELNHNKPFDRFRVADKKNLELFVKHIQPDWKIPTYQRVLNWSSGVTFLTTVIYVVVQWLFMKRKKTSDTSGP
ncbi:MAG TPA: hypothetical protein VN653_15200 [Anaerolineales bacterium]|nr:hypothetical protein [Anaerolineales bacterium]